MTLVDRSKVLLTRQDHVLTLTINRVEARNAVDHDVCQLIGAAVRDADADSDVRAIVLTGSGDAAFCAGADLKAIARGETILPEGMEHWSFAGFVNQFTSKPTIAAVNGNALGGGLELALACDLVVAVESASFGLPEVKRGLIAGAGGAFRIGQQLPQKKALELLLTGDPISADEALRWGLVNQVVPTGQALSAALILAARVASNAPLAVQASKRVAYAVVDGPRGLERQAESTAWTQTADELDALLSSADALEGPRAFAEKREPIWSSR